MATKGHDGGDGELQLKRTARSSRRRRRRHDRHDVSAGSAARSRQHNRANKKKFDLPPALIALIETMRENIEHAQQAARNARPYWLNVGRPWLEVKSHPLLDEIGGIKALTPFLPHYPQWLNRCAVAYDGHITGDLTKGELWVKHTGYKLRNDYEPYMMAEIIEAYRNRSKPRSSPRLPLAISAGRLFVRSEVELFD